MTQFSLHKECKIQIARLQKVLHKVLARRKAYVQKIIKQRATLQKVIQTKQAIEQEKRNIEQEKIRIVAEKDKTIGEITAHLQKLVEVLENLRRPPIDYAIFIRAYPDCSADILINGREVRIPIDTTLDPKELKLGSKVMLSTGKTMAIIDIAENQGSLGYEAEFVGFYGDNSALVEDIMGNKSIVLLSDLVDNKTIVRGSMVQIENGVLVSPIEDNFIDLGVQSSKYTLAEMPDVSIEDIGGLGNEIKTIIEDIEDPFLYPEIYEAYNLEKNTNILLHGLPGNGKTLIAKLIAKIVFEKFKDKILPHAKGNFIAIDGPELSTMWQGLTEEKIRDIFDNGSELAKVSGAPVFIFFDDCESFLRRRGSGISSDAKDDYVTQFNTCVNGIQELKGVNIILATNRIDLLDAAVVRRTDIKIRIPSPNTKERAADVFKKHLLKTKLKQSETIDSMIGKVVTNIFDGADSDYLEIHFKDDSRRVFKLSDMLSGKIIADIVKRAKKIAKNRDKALPEQERPTGISIADLQSATETEFLMNESLPSNAESINDWLQQLGQTTEVASFKNLWKEKRNIKSEDSFDLTQ